MPHKQTFVYHIILRQNKYFKTGSKKYKTPIGKIYKISFFLYKNEPFMVANLEYIDGKIVLRQDVKKKAIPTHLLFGVKLDDHKTQ